MDVRMVKSISDAAGVTSGPAGSGETGRLRVLGIESSCDDTAAAVVEGKTDAAGEEITGRVRSAVNFTQDHLHDPFGGVVPEIAARAHAERTDLVVEEALALAGCRLQDLDAIAVTAGPGLAPGLLAGVMTARGLAAGGGLPLYGINHLEAHALTVRMVGPTAFPYLLLLASGGHCLFAAVGGPGRYAVYGATRDDAPGEAYDKVARLLGLGFPGGPAVEVAARGGDGARFAFPRPLAGRLGASLSFSGLKTAVRRERERFGALDETDRRDLAASFQAAIRDVLCDRAVGAMHRFREDYPELQEPVFAGAGGVLANQVLREGLAAGMRAEGFRPVFPEPEFCTDNGAMVAWAGIERRAVGEAPWFDFPVRARWPLESLAGD